MTHSFKLHKCIDVLCKEARVQVLQLSVAYTKRKPFYVFISHDSCENENSNSCFGKYVALLSDHLHRYYGDTLQDKFLLVDINGVKLFAYLNWTRHVPQSDTTHPIHAPCHIVCLYERNKARTFSRHHQSYSCSPAMLTAILIAHLIECIMRFTLYRHFFSQLHSYGRNDYHFSKRRLEVIQSCAKYYTIIVLFIA